MSPAHSPKEYQLRDIYINDQVLSHAQQLSLPSPLTSLLEGLTKAPVTTLLSLGPDHCKKRTSTAYIVDQRDSIVLNEYSYLRSMIIYISVDSN
jgi:hypothetical protein